MAQQAKQRHTKTPADAQRLAQAARALAAPQAATDLQRAADNPAAASPRGILALQKRVGNRAVARMLASRAPVQAKLTVGPADDAYEREAERVASQVVSAAPLAATPDDQGGAPGAQRSPLALAGRASLDAAAGLRADASAGFDASADFQQQLDGQLGRGQALPDHLRAQMEPRFGARLDSVRIHTGAPADTLNRAIHARAFTAGRDIFFRQGEYAPANKHGQRLLAHELTHTLQQTGGQPLQRKPNTTPTPGRLQRAAPGRLQRALMTVDAFRQATNARRRGGYIDKVDKALKAYHADKSPDNLTALRFALEKYVATKGDGDSQKTSAARDLLGQVREEESQQPEPLQLKTLMAHTAELESLQKKADILKVLNGKLKGADANLRESLKTAIVGSPLAPATLKQKVAALNLTGALDGGARALVEQLIKDLSKKQKPETTAVYHSLYARCMELVSAIYRDHDSVHDYMKVLPTKAEKNFALLIYKVSKIESDALTLSFARKLGEGRQAAQDELKAQGKKPLDVVVMGAGPVGMIAAIEAHLSGANVQVYELRRTGPARANVLKLTEPTFHKLRRLGLYGDLFGPDAPKGSSEHSHGVSVAYLEDTLRARAAQLGVRINYGYGLEDITPPGDDGGKTRVRLKKYVPTRAGPEMDLYNKLKDAPDYIDATSDLVIGATGAGGATREKLGITSDRKSGDQGQEYIDFTGVGLFEHDGKTEGAPSADPSRDRAWMVGLRTPAVDYLLTQITRQEFILYKDNDQARDAFMAKVGKDAAKFGGRIKRSSVFDITLNQARQFVNERASGVVIGDEAATPHPLTGSGFNTGASSTEFIPGLVKGLGRAQNKQGRQDAFTKYGTGVKMRTDKMVNMGSKFFEGNIDKLTKMNQLPMPPPVLDQPKDVQDDDEQEQGTGRPGSYELDLQKDGPLLDDPEAAYAAIQQRIDALFGIPSLRDED